MDAAKLDPLTVTASDLAILLGDGQVSSVYLVEMYLDQIERHNKHGAKIGAIISTSDRAEVLAIARHLDSERAEKGPRGPMHGIPIIVKDVFLTPSLGMNTSCGSYALKDLTASKDADAIESLIKSGMIVIGKANLSELGNYKGYKMPAGWSAVGGQTQSPYVRGGILPDALPLGHSTPASSSSGSAAGVAAGFAPVSVATETDGSLVQPATRAGLYGMKGTLHSVSTLGAQPISPVLDCIGAMAKSPRDLAHVFDILQPGSNYTEFLTGSWEGLKVGFVVPIQWQPADFIVEPREDFLKQSLTAFENAISEIAASGGQIVRSVPLIRFPEIFENGVDGISDTSDFMGHDFRNEFENFLELFGDPSMRTLEDLIKFNEEHPELEFPPESPGQEILINALNNNMTDETYNAGLKHTRERATGAIEKLFEENGFDAVLGPSDGRIASVAAAAGYPVATVPLGFADFNGRAFGINIISTAKNEGKILQIMSAWEKTFPNARIPPPLLSNWTTADSLPHI